MVGALHRLHRLLDVGHHPGDLVTTIVILIVVSLVVVWAYELVRRR